MHVRIAMIDIILSIKVKKNLYIGGELIIVLWCGKYFLQRMRKGIERPRISIVKFSAITKKKTLYINY